MNRWLSRQMIGFFVIVTLAGCVDYQEPTGPLPQPEPEDGELTSVVWQADGSSAAGRRVSRAPGSVSTSEP
jgi:hypothetical protein